MRVIRISLIACMALILFLGIISCGHSNEPPETGPPQITGEGPRPEDAANIQQNDTQVTDTAHFPDADDPYRFYGQTLTIASAHTNTLERLARTYMLLNPGVTVEVIESDWEQIIILLDADDAPTLICRWIFNIYDQANAGLIADWLPIMDAEPSFNEDDYFMNFFYASSVNGRLYAFPIEFLFDFVTANSTVPGLAEAMEWYSARYGGITASQLMGLQRSFAALNPLLHDHNFDVTIGARNNIHDFLDWNTRQVDFYNQHFIDFINTAREFTSPDREPFGSWRLYMTTPPSREAELSEAYMFYYITPLMLQYLIQFEEDFLFTGTTPIVNSHGELVVRTGNAYVLSAAANPVQQALALDFVQFMASRGGRYIMITHDMAGHSVTSHSPLVFPVNRDTLQFKTEGNFSQILPMTMMSFYGQKIVGTRAEAVSRVFEQLTAIGEMPMAPVQPGNILDIIYIALIDFHSGWVAAEHVAYELQERITEALREME